jgi:hypothetical protein
MLEGEDRQRYCVGVEADSSGATHDWMFRTGGLRKRSGCVICMIVDRGTAGLRSDRMRMLSEDGDVALS